MLNESPQKITVGERACAEILRPVGKNPSRDAALVIDDEPLLRGSVAATLEEQGWRVTEAADAGSSMSGFNE